MDLALAVVGRPLGLQQLLGHTLELALAAGGEIAALGTGGAVLIQERGNLQLVPDALGDALGHLDGFLHGHVHLGDEGDDVGRAHALVLAVVLVHVDALGGDLRELEGDLLDGLGGADEGENAAVVVAVGLSVEQGAAGDALRGLDELVIGGLVLFLGAAEIGDAFDQSCHDKFPPFLSGQTISNLYFDAYAVIIPCARAGVNRFSFSFVSGHLIFLSKAAPVRIPR